MPTPATAPVAGIAPATEDLGPLAWVLEEIQKSVDATSKSLKRFLRESNGAPDADIGQLRVARQQLHQAVGALQMVDQRAPALVLGAMEFAVQSFVQEPSRCNEAAVLKMDRAGFAVADFLNAMLAGKTVSSVALFPQYRDVLELVGNERVHPADLWTTSWHWANISLQSHKPALVYDPAVRSRLDREVLKVVKSGDDEAARRLQEICVGLSRGAGVPHVADFWAIAAAFFEALGLALVPADVYVKRAASRVLLQYATLARSDNTVSERLAHDLLFFCAQAVPGIRDEARILRAVRAAWGIAGERAVDYATEQFGRFDPVVLAQARKRIETAKEMWSALSGGDVTRLRQVADTFAQLAESLQKLHPPSLPMAQALTNAVESSIKSGKPPKTELAMEVATSVLYLEAAFEDLDPHDRQLTARTVQLAGRIERARESGQSEPLESWMEELYRRVSDRQTMGTVVDELRAHLGELEKSLDQFFRRPAEKTLLRTVPTQLMQMRGVFSVLGLEQAAQTVQRMRDNVEQLMAGSEPADESGAFDSLGNNLGALGFLIDMLGYQPTLAKRLFVFDEKTGELKPLMGRQAAEAEEVAEPAPVAPVAVPVAAPLAAPVAAPVALAPTSAAVTPPRAESLLSADEIDAQIAARLAALATPKNKPATPIEEFRRATDSWTAKITGPAPLEALPDTEVTELDEDDLQSIFLDEAREVLHNGLAAIAALGRDPADIGELTVLRRAFHTLKGSSRMVGLTEYGNAAWSFEQVLNTWLADQRPATPDLLEGAGTAMRDFAKWVEAIASGEPHTWQAEPFHTLAEALSSGQQIPAPAPMPSADQLAVAARRIADEPPAPAPVAEPVHVSVPLPDSAYARPPMPELPDLDFASTDFDTPSFDVPVSRSDVPPFFAPSAPPTSAPLADAATDWSGLHSRGAVDETPARKESYDEFLGSFDTTDLAGLDEPAQPVKPDTAAIAGAEDIDFFAAAAPSAQDFSFESTDLQPLADMPSDASMEAPMDAPVEAMIDFPLELTSTDEAPAAPAVAPVVEVDFDPQEPAEAEPLPQAAAPLEEAAGAEVPPHELTAATLDTDAVAEAQADAGAVVDAQAAGVADAAVHADAAMDPVAALDAEVDATADADSPIEAVAGHEPVDVAAEPELVATAAAAEPPAPPSADDPIKAIGPLRIGIALYNVFLNEADEWSRQLASDVSEWALEPGVPMPDSAVALAHSLAGSSATVGFQSLSGMSRLLESALQHLHLQGGGTPQQGTVLIAATEELRRLLHQFAAGFLKEPAPETLAALREVAASPMPVEADEPVVARAEEERAEAALEAGEGPDVEPAEAEAVEVEGLEAGPAAGEIETDEAERAAAESVEASIPAFEPVEAERVETERVEAQPVEAEAQSEATDAEADAAEAVQAVEPAQAVEPLHAVEPVHAVERFEPVLAVEPVEAIQASPAEPQALAEPVAAAPAVPAPSAEVRTVVTMPAFAVVEPAVYDDSEDPIDLVDAVDADLFPIFEEEAAELLPQLGTALRAWHEQPEVMAPRASILRTLHTLKGSARLAGAMRLGERAHRMESEIELLGNESVPREAIGRLLARHDVLQATFDDLRAADDATQAQVANRAAEAAAATRRALVEEVPAPAMPAVAEADESANEPLADPSQAAQLSPSPSTARSALPTPVALAVSRQASSQAVRVRTQLLDRLVAQAGEVIITRSRLEVEIGQLRSSLTDLTGNLDRLRQQLRDIEVQAESQMQSRLAQAKDSQQGFDPLEFDRFTRVQELTRMMAESVNDVATVQRTLQKTVQATEDDLSAQARQTRELQRGLLRTRMVQFEDLSERLYRVVRQASKDTGKQVRLDITGGNIEMDRGVLDRMTPAFEHLLRNCVAHGIEDAEVRERAGKEASGFIGIELHHEGNDVSVSFRDDGAGLDHQRIAERARALGLIAWDHQPSDQEVSEFIFQPGFSTAAQVSELAGRGIGMDVVRSHVAALGGRIETQSTPGQGTTFKLVLPLTTAVTHVVMLRAGNVSFGVPSGLVELVQRASAADLESAYLNQQYGFGGEQVPYFWSGALLQASARSERGLAKNNVVVVVRSAAQRVALHVDEVLGNQEVVVKNLGPQLARLPGMAGISVLASGAVALIYNPVALAAVHGDQARALQATGIPSMAKAGAGGHANVPVAVEAQQAPPQVPLVLVVDDSITVRRVTQRLLQREGYRVALAADGLQALERLQQERPAVVLSDIEMPRMDGFDLARNIRADESLAGMPIIMITSRIAEKHREHAKQLGVNHYLGKPYSEEELLRLVRAFTDDRVLAAAA
ncbi:Hpt domain-containing protein [Variovorax sp. dw_954]|uniref:hybrid sensor histidine kinase/response regulator n=1 Tax=Variovorax sp. dw_954 TaxID=2720078 RepID=UPI0031F663F1